MKEGKLVFRNEKVVRVVIIAVLSIFVITSIAAMFQSL